MGTYIKMEDLTPHEKEFLKAYRGKPEQQAQVDEALGVKIGQMSEEEYEKFFTFNLYQLALEWITLTPENELPAPKPSADASLGEKIEAFGINMVSFGFMKGIDVERTLKQ